MQRCNSLFYPICLDLRGRQCLVVGGGQVALRKVKALLECGASVKVVSPELCRQIRNLARCSEIEVVPRGYETADLRGVLVVIAATNDAEVNKKVAAQAESRGLLVNVVDDPGKSVFIAPAYVRRGDVTIAVSTGGRSPALARRIRIRLESEYGPEYGLLAELLGQIRNDLKGKGVVISPDRWQEALDLEPLLCLLASRRTGEAREMVLQSLGVTTRSE